MSLPDVVSQDEWLVARKRLLAQEKAMTRARDALNAERRRMPMVRIEKDYRLHGPDGEVGLLDLFEGRRQLIVGHFMFDPAWTDGCSSCSAGADEVSKGLLDHLHVRDTTLAYVSRAPLAQIEAYKDRRGWTAERRGWTFPWYSSFGSGFNYDFQVTLDEAVAPPEYNFRTAAEYAAAGDPLPLEPGGSAELPGTSFFLRDGDEVFHTNSIYARGAEMTGGSYYFLDLTALGRQEPWEEPKGRADRERRPQPNFSE